MEELTLVEDLRLHFQEEKENLKKEISLVDPMAGSIRKSATAHFFQSSYIVILQIVAWVFIFVCIGLILFMDKVAPFYYLAQLAHDSDILRKYRQGDLEILEWCVKGLVFIIAILLFLNIRMLGKMRHKNDLIQLTGKNLKLLMEHYFKREADIAKLEKKYPVELPDQIEGIIPPKPPGFKDGEDILL